MQANLSQKERMLLEDQKKHEEICVKKYNEYANRAQDPQLKQLFSNYATQEQHHLDTINQILAGQIPAMNQQQGQQQGQQQSQQQGQQQNQAMAQGTQPGVNAGPVNQNDAALCNDILMTEKFVSSAYNTAIFEFRDSNIRQILNHIQKEEQQHGEGVFNYMQSRGMYKVQ